MDENDKLIINIRLDRAKEDIQTALELLDLGRNRGAVNRAYYAIFTMTTALLLTEGIIRGKHSGVQAAFHQYFIKRGIVEPEYGQIFTAARKSREDCDYSDDVIIEQGLAKRTIEKCQKFLSRIEQYLKEIGAISPQGA